jgi:uncharacterized NAD(P)/FAD-binding protein YdhS
MTTGNVFEAGRRRHHPALMQEWEIATLYPAAARALGLSLSAADSSGAVLAWHLHRTAPYRHEIVVIEPREEVGRGLAYDSRDPAHRVNVPALKMNLDFDEEGHFEQWLIASGYPERDPASVIADVHLFPTRAPSAITSMPMSGSLAMRSNTEGRKRAVLPHQSGHRVLCDDGEDVLADAVVLAVCHTPPDVPSSLAPLQNAPGSSPIHGNLTSFAASAPTIASSLSEPASPWLILSLRSTTKAIVGKSQQSRGAACVQTHATQFSETLGDFASNPSRTTLALLRHVRRVIADAARDGKSWHPVLDQMRLQGLDIWRALPLNERARLIRHLRPFWDTYRFRIAPQVDAVIARRIGEDTLKIQAASVRAGARENTALSVDLRARHSRTWEPAPFDAIVLATGPAHGSVFGDNPLLGQMSADGLARPDPLGLGIEVDVQSRAIGRDGRSAGTLFVAGPLARGTFGELMGAPDLARHARNIAETLTAMDLHASQLPPRPVQA